MPRPTDARVRSPVQAEELSSDGRPRRVDALSAADLKRALSSLGVRATDVQLDAFLRRLDQDGNGSVSLREFGRFVYLMPQVDVAKAFGTWSQQIGLSLDSGQEPGQALLVQSGASAALQPASASAVFIAGAAAGVVSRTCTAPLDRLKMLMQVGPSEITAVHARPSKGVVAGLRLIYERGGFISFFQGNTANVIKVMPESGVKFWVYDAARAAICAQPSAPQVHERLLAGAAAGAASCVAIYPLEVAKTRLGIAAPGTYSGILHCMRHTVAREGAGALYKGLGASLVGIIPFSAVDLALYNTFKESAHRYLHGPASRDAPTSTLTMLGCGAASSSLAQLVTYPLALAKTRMQAAGMPGYDKRWTSLSDCLRQTVRHEGLRGLYRGIVPNLLKAVPSISISYVVFENCKRKAQQQGW